MPTIYVPACIQGVHSQFAFRSRRREPHGEPRGHRTADSDVGDVESRRSSAGHVAGQVEPVRRAQPARADAAVLLEQHREAARPRLLPRLRLGILQLLRQRRLPLSKVRLHGHGEGSEALEA
eukprot:scaffold109176_cov62-Phaeocystis_antarctica.AAC.8